MSAVKILWIIPVRAGSKGLPGKNGLCIHKGLSLLEWCITNALNSRAGQNLCVTTDCPELGSQAQRMGVPVVRRPDYLATDKATSINAVEHALSVYKDARHFKAVGVLQVTSPLRIPSDIDAAACRLEGSQWDSVVSVCLYGGPHPAKMYLEEGSSLIPVLAEAECDRRQDLGRILRRNGAIYVTRRQALQASSRLWSGRLTYVEMPVERSVDIDTADDLRVARSFIQHNEDIFRARL